MKVLHFYKTYLPDTIGGLEQSINQIARGTLKYGVEVEVLTLSPNVVDRDIKVDQHLVHRCRSNFEIASTPFSLSAFYRFKQLVDKADLVHYHFPYPFTDILHFLTRVKKPTVVTYHADIVKQQYALKLYRPLKHCFLNSVDHVVATSPNYLESSKVLSKIKQKVSVIPLGIDKATYPGATEEKLKYWKERFSGKFFLFVGVIRYYKGLHILVEAIKNSAFPVLIVGAGPIEKELKMHAEKLDIRNLHFLGFLPEEDKYALLELCFAVLFPSHLRSEAFGISLLEGAMYGKPLISSEIGTGTTYINIDKETGVVVPPSNPVALRQAMDFLWNNPDVASEMGKKAEQRYWTLFTADRMAKSYVSLYEKLLSLDK